jgi:hypothetical protein
MGLHVLGGVSGAALAAGALPPLLRHTLPSREGGVGPPAGGLPALSLQQLTQGLRSHHMLDPLPLLWGADGKLEVGLWSRTGLKTV